MVYLFIISWCFQEYLIQQLVLFTDNELYIYCNLDQAMAKIRECLLQKYQTTPKKPDFAGFGNDTLDTQYFEHMFPLSNFVWAVGYLFFFYIYLGRYYFVIFADINLFFLIMIAYRFQHMFSLIIYFVHQDIAEIL